MSYEPMYGDPNSEKVKNTNSTSILMASEKSENDSKNYSKNTSKYKKTSF